MPDPVDLALALALGALGVIATLAVLYGLAWWAERSDDDETWWR